MTLPHASGTLSQLGDGVLVAVLAFVFCAFILGLLIGVYLGIGHGARRQLARSAEPVTTLFKTSTKPDQYYQ